MKKVKIEMWEDQAQTLRLVLARLDRGFDQRVRTAATEGGYPPDPCHVALETSALERERLNQVRMMLEPK